MLLPVILAATAAIPFLGIGIPTVPRQGAKGDEPPAYLERTLRSLVTQVNETQWESGALKVWVMNMHPGAHPVFERCKKEWEDLEWLEFLENGDPIPPDVDAPLQPDFYLRASREEYQKLQHRTLMSVRRQALDVVRLLEHAQGRSQYYMFAEDDFELCPSGMQAVKHVLRKAQARFPTGWSAMRVGFGLNGILTPGNDLLAISRYLRAHHARRLPDLLLTEWYLAERPEARQWLEGRPSLAFRYNILRHIGTNSAVTPGKKWATLPGCFAELGPMLVNASEAWTEAECPGDDLRPCPSESTLLPVWKR